MKTWILTVTMVALCTEGTVFDAQARPPIVEITGMVIDAETNQPIEGAYVLASYKVFRANEIAAKSFCVKTLGMTTGKDGLYRFPVEKMDGNSPHATNAIKPGYRLERIDYAKPGSLRAQEGYANRNIYLRKQDPAHPAYRFSDHEEVCEEANGEGLAPALRFIEMEIAEEKRFGAPANAVRAHEDLVRSLQHLPSANTYRPIEDRIDTIVSCSVDMSTDARPCCIQMAAADGFVPLRDRIRASGLPFTVNETTRAVCVRRQDKPRALEIAGEIAKSLRPRDPS